LWIVAGLFLVVIMAMAPALTGDWLGDDRFLVTKASCNQGIEHIPKIVLQEAGRCNYRPLRHISYAVDFSVWGPSPLGYHLTNVLLHLATILVVFTVLRLFGLSLVFASVGAALFSLHPVQVDAVAYISGRRDVLMGLGYVLSVLGAVQISRLSGRESTGAARAGWAALALVGAVVSVTSKEMGVSVVATITLLSVYGGYDGLRIGGKPSQTLWRRILKHRWLLLALSVPAGMVVAWRAFLKPMSTVADSLFGGSLARHIATVLSTHARYGEIIVFPWRLAGDYAPPVIEIPSGLLSPLPLLGALWLGALVGLSTHFYQRGWLKASFGLAWYLVTMLPVSHIIPHHEIAAEHYLYIPLVGLALSVAALLQRGWSTHVEDTSPRTRRVFTAMIVVVLVLLATRTFVRAFDYRSEISHAQATVAHFPASVRGRARLGLALLKEQGLEQAKPHLEYVLGTSFQGSARTDVLRALGQYFVAEGDYQKGSKLLAEYGSLRPKDRASLEALSKAYFETARIEAARNVNQRLVFIAPKNAEYRYKYALTAWLSGEQDTARIQIRRALALDAEHLDALLLGATLTAESDRDEARSILERAERVARKRADEPLVRQRRLLRKLREKLDYVQDELDQ
jgi:tetratricopeptide (TPR) repeat protein